MRKQIWQPDPQCCQSQHAREKTEAGPLWGAACDQMAQPAPVGRSSSTYFQYSLGKTPAVTGNCLRVTGGSGDGFSHHLDGWSWGWWVNTPTQTWRCLSLLTAKAKGQQCCSSTLNRYGPEQPGEQTLISGRGPL